MSALISGFVTLDKLKQIVETLEKKQLKGFKFTASVSDESKEYNPNDDTTIYQNVGFYAEQSKEDRDAKKKKFYFANGSVFWTDGVIKKAGPAGAPAANSTAKQAGPPPQTSQPSADDLPF